MAAAADMLSPWSPGCRLLGLIAFTISIYIIEFRRLILALDEGRAFSYNLRILKGGGSMAGVTGYCVKCKKKTEMKNPKAVTLKNKRKATKGECPKCGTKMFRIGG
jgi:hypothetical protein